MRANIVFYRSGETLNSATALIRIRVNVRFVRGPTVIKRAPTGIGSSRPPKVRKATSRRHRHTGLGTRRGFSSSTSRMAAAFKAALEQRLRNASKFGLDLSRRRQLLAARVRSIPGPDRPGVRRCGDLRVLEIRIERARTAPGDLSDAAGRIGPKKAASFTTVC
jgi:hypothetical protein